MDAAVVRQIVSVAEELDLNMEIIFDNQEILNTKIQGTIVEFNDAQEVVSYVRVSDSPNLMFRAPFEIRFRTYESIQNIAIQAGNVDMNKIIKKMSKFITTKADKMLDMVNTSPANNTYHATPSTVDVMDREGTKPSIVRTDEYGSGKRNKVEIPKPVTVTLNKDGSIPEGVEIPQVAKPEDFIK